MAKINSLNVDTLLEVFGFLDLRSLKTCCMVCKDWENIIGTSELMKKLPLVIEKRTLSKSDQLHNLKRSYSHIIIKSIHFHELRSLKNLENFLPRTLELERVGVSDDTLEIFLNLNEKLRKLVITDCHTTLFKNPSTLNSLRSLSITNSSLSFSKMFPLCKNVQELKIHLYSGGCTSLPDMRNFCFELMTSQEKLETLIITSCFQLDEKTVVEAKYNLKQLSVCNGGIFKNCEDRFELNARLLQIMERHKNTLENLEMFGMNDNFMEFIMKNLKVQRLFIDAAWLPTDRQVYIRTQPNVHLKKLIIGRHITKAEALQGLFRTYPRIESLIIKNWWPEDINEGLIDIASILKSLKFLHIPTLISNTPDAPMPSLRTFNVDFLDGIQNFLAFCFNIPSIENLAIKQFEASTFTTENIQIMTSRLLQLRHIKFGEKFELTSEILDVFSSNCLQLRLIEMVNNLDNSKSNVTHGKVQVVYFSQCSAPHVFKEEKTLCNKYGEIKRGNGLI